MGRFKREKAPKTSLSPAISHIFIFPIGQEISDQIKSEVDVREKNSLSNITLNACMFFKKTSCYSLATQPVRLYLLEVLVVGDILF